MKEKIFVSGKLANSIREKRREKGMNQEELSFQAGFSSSTLSALEAGYKQFNRAKLETICTILEIDIDDINEEPSVETINYSLEELLKTIEVEIMDNPDTALETLRQTEEIYKHINQDEPILYAYGPYLRGRCALRKDEREKALHYFEQGIQMAEVEPDLRYTNLVTACCYQISRLCNYDNKLQKALGYIEKGFASFYEEGERTNLFYLLCINKASVWDKMKYYSQALSLVEKTCEHQKYSISSDAKLNLYQLRVELLNKLNRHMDSIPIAQTGLELARVDNNSDRKFEFLSSLGESHAKLGNLDMATRYYQLARCLESKISKGYVAISTYTNLGILQMKQEQYADAEQSLRTAVCLGEEQKDDYRLCQALRALGELYYHIKKDKKATKNLEQALAIANTLSIDIEAAHLLMLLSKLSLRSKDMEQKKYIDQFLQLMASKTVLGGASMFHHDPPED
ncbi:tetratricopeptide (TPR) repeat protein [Croceifilum oryzae]|uniref:Tetratricopeptide (TPR) repeat protein n=1 Tax=Croceifilum oryzae TaxID=1553429 RepID=A0AAJ1TM31_9BACL|nr:tetratricopeptide repeat protein [Croceifilum oryzae]MDQ0417180.1 tetratricopeptide (TPR) repeat protein [Croceifilum oryzae]